MVLGGSGTSFRDFVPGRGVAADFSRFSMYLRGAISPMRHTFGGGEGTPEEDLDPIFGPECSKWDPSKKTSKAKQKQA